MHKPFTLITVIFLLAVAIAHLGRLILHVDVIVAGHAIPQWLSVAGFAIAATLAVQTFRESRC